MLPFLLASVLVTGGFEAGGQIGVVFPASGLERTLDAAALFGASLGYEVGLNRLALDYSYFGLQAKQASPYRFNVHNLSLGYCREFILGRASSGSASNWGFEATAAAGLGLLSRIAGSARETGRAPSGILGVGFFQRQGRCRLSLDLVQSLFLEKDRNGSTGIAVGQLLSLRAGVAASMVSHPKKAVKEAPIPQPPTPEIPEQPRVELDLVTIHFDFDKSVIRPGDANTLEGNARQLLDAVKQDVKPTVTIEGYCDPIGTSEYNMALGQRRAESAKAYLVKLGVPADRLLTTSYGEEKLVTTDKTKYEMNRRCEFKTK
jgi:outer membrane protein OmpA-like peptidoglycan-associated protein